MNEQLNRAIQEHLSGRVENAVAMYQRILDQEPQTPEALYLLGLTAVQSGDLGRAAGLIQRAIALKPQEADYHHHLGLVMERMGCLPEAAEAYKNALRSDPARLEAFRSLLRICPGETGLGLWLGNLLFAKGSLTEALKYYQLVADQAPDNAAALNNMGCILQRLGRHTEAETAFRRVLTLSPENAEGLNNLGYALYLQGKLEGAMDCYGKAVALNPDFKQAWLNLATVLQLNGNYAETVEAFRNCIRLTPENAEAHFKLGYIHHRAHNFSDAIKSYELALQLKPESPEYCNNLACALMENGAVEASLEYFERCLGMQPDFVDGLCNLGRAYKKLGRLDEAARKMKQALRLKPDLHMVHNELGMVYAAQGRYQQAMDCYHKTLQLNPDYAEACYNIGCALEGTARFQEALIFYQQAIQKKPDFAEAHVNKALLLLLHGRYAEGWQAYEWRFKRKDLRGRYWNRYGVPLWDGGPFHGKRLYIQKEQGLGDTIQFARFFPLVKALGGTVIFEAEKPLIPLLKQVAGLDEVVEFQGTEHPAPVDLHIYLFSLPTLLGTTLETLPATCPYIHADQGKVEYWRRRLNHPDLKVGLVWAGNPENKDDAFRSCHLSQFEPLSQIPGVQLYSLQKGTAAGQVSTVTWAERIVCLGEELKDFTDTAAVMANLDLLIAVDTVVVHLAGAMGRPVWNLRHAKPYWVWMLEKTDSVWYPTMQIYRQEQLREWGPVIDRVGADLTLMAQSRLPSSAINL